MNGITFGQYIPRSSFIHHLDPRSKLYLVVILMVAILMVDSWAAVILTVVYACSMVLLSGIPVRVYLESSKALWVILTITVAFQIFFVPGQIIWRWGIISISDMGIRMGILMAYRLAMIYLLAQLLTFTTAPLQLTEALERLLKPLERVGVPAHELAMIMTIALRFIPIFFEESSKITKAQTSRGANFQGGINSLRNLVAIMVPLFTRAFNRADELALAMESRCYQGGEGRTRMNSLIMTERDYLAMAVTTVLAIIIMTSF